MPPIFRSLTHRPFLLLWSGQSISRMGDYFYNIALAWWVLQKTASPEAMSLVLILSYTPMLLFLLIGGVTVDRFPRVPIMLISDITRGLLVAGIAALNFAGHLEVWHVGATSLMFGIMDAFFDPAYAALLPEITPTAHLSSANALTSMSVQFARIVGPLVGSSLITLGDTTLAFGINAASFFISALCLLPLLLTITSTPKPDIPAATPDSHKRPSLWQDLRAGFAVVGQTPFIWVTILITAFINITLGGPYNLALPYLVKTQFNGEIGFLGGLYAMFPLGYLLGGMWAGQQTRIRHRGWTIFINILLAGLGMFIIGLPLHFVVLMLAALGNGIALQISGIVWTTTLQELVPKEKLGRAVSIDNLGSRALYPIGLALTGWATEKFGAGIICLVGGGTTMLMALVALAQPPIRDLD